MSRLIALALLLVMLPLTSPALGAQPDADRARAEQLVDAGLTLARGGKFRRAVEKFEEANRLYPHPEIQHNLARAHEELGELKQAHYWFSQALKSDYTYARDGRERLHKIEEELLKTNARLTVRTTPSQVEVRLTMADGQEERHISTPFQTWVPAGHVTVTGTNPSFKTNTRELELAAGEERQINLVLAPLPKQGFLSVQVNRSGAAIYLGEVQVGVTPLENLPYPAGVYDLAIVAEGFEPYRQSVIIKQDELTTVTVALTRPDGAAPDGTGADGTSPLPTPDDEASTSGVPSWVGATLVGVGAATVIAAVVLHVKAFKTNADANEIPISTDPAVNARYDSLYNEALGYQTDAVVTYIGAGVLIGTGAVLLAMADDDDEEATKPADAEVPVTWVPSFGVSPDYIGAGAIVSF